MGNIKQIIKHAIGYEGSVLQKRRQSYKEQKLCKEKGTALRKVGIELLNQLFDAAKKSDIGLWLEFGTLLGAFREHSFIAHDYDIDTGMWASDYTLDFENTLLAKGFNKKRVFYQIDVATQKKTMTEVTLSYKGFDVDIFLSFPTQDKKRLVYVYGMESDEMAKCGFYNVREYNLPYIEELQELSINGYVFHGPKNSETTLKCIYGSTFMVPDPMWKTPDSKLNVKLLLFEDFRGQMYGTW